MLCLDDLTCTILGEGESFMFGDEDDFFDDDIGFGGCAYARNKRMRYSYMDYYEEREFSEGVPDMVREDSRTYHVKNLVGMQNGDKLLEGSQRLTLQTGQVGPSNAFDGHDPEDESVDKDSFGVRTLL